MKQPLLVGFTGATLVVLATVVSVGVDPAPAKESPAAAEAATPVRTVEARASEGAAVLRTSGVVASRSESDLTFKIAGYVAEVRVEEGDRVRAGDVLARLEMTEADARLRAAEAHTALAEKQLRRMERLFADSVVAAVQLDEARSAYDGARADLDLARFDHTYATIRAPSDGRILSRAVEVAEFTTPGAPAFRFGSTEEGWVVRVHVADHQVVRLRPGGQARVVIPGLDPGGVSGRVVELADAADPRSGTFQVEVELEVGGDGQGPDRGLRSGMIGEVEMELVATSELAPVDLPPHALIDARGRDGAVFVVVGGRAVRRSVRIVDIGANRVSVEGTGLLGARVVTAGAAYLQDGERIAPLASF